MNIFRNIIAMLLCVLFCTYTAAEEKAIEDTITLNPVIVTGTPVSSNANSLPASITVISREEIEKTEESSVLSSLKGQVPGLLVTERGTTGFGLFTGSGGGISLRGIGGSPTTQVLIAIDGHPQMMGINGHDLPDAYIAGNAENIEVIRGPASTLYGSNSMGGVINIITREQKKDGQNLNGSIMLGSYNTQKYQLSLSTKKNRLTGFLSANYDKTDGHRRFSGFHLFNAYAKAGYTLSPHFSTTADFSLAKYLSTDPGSITKPATSDSLTADVTRGMASLSLDNRYEKTSGEVRLYYDFGHHEIYDGWQSDDINAGVMANQSGKLWQGSTFTLGVDYHLYGGNAIRSNNPNFSLDKIIHETALYLLAQQNLLDKKLTFDAGMRLEMNSLFGNEWVPRIGLSYRPVETSVLKLSTAKGFRNPTIRELYVFAANESLQPESMMNYEVSYLQFSDNKRFRSEVTIFLSKGENMIQTVVSGGIPKYYNTGSFRNKGLEVGLQYNCRFPLKLSANYSYINSEKPILATPKHQINASAEYAFGKWNLLVNLQDIKDYCLQTTTPVKENFTLLDARINYKISNPVSVFCKVENMLNTQYQMNYNYPMPGTTLMCGMKISL